jgi:hypothetical protein
MPAIVSLVRSVGTWISRRHPLCAFHRGTFSPNHCTRSSQRLPASNRPSTLQVNDHRIRLDDMTSLTSTSPLKRCRKEDNTDSVYHKRTRTSAPLMHHDSTQALVSTTDFISYKLTSVVS